MIKYFKEINIIQIIKHQIVIFLLYLVNNNE